MKVLVHVLFFKFHINYGTLDNIIIIIDKNLNIITFSNTSYLFNI